MTRELAVEIRKMLAGELEEMMDMAEMNAPSAGRGVRPLWN